MSFQSKITLTGQSDVPSFSDLVYQKQDIVAAALFDTNLENEVRKQLKAISVAVPDKGTEWDDYIAAHLTKATITGTDSSVILLDATLDGSNNITDYKAILVQWEGKGYSTIMQNPINSVKTFE